MDFDRFDPMSDGRPGAKPQDGVPEINGFAGNSLETRVMAVGAEDDTEPAESDADNETPDLFGPRVLSARSEGDASEESTLVEMNAKLHAIVEGIAGLRAVQKKRDTAITTAVLVEIRSSLKVEFDKIASSVIERSSSAGEETAQKHVAVVRQEIHQQLGLIKQQQGAEFETMQVALRERVDRVEALHKDITLFVRVAAFVVIAVFGLILALALFLAFA